MQGNTNTTWAGLATVLLLSTALAGCAGGGGQVNLKQTGSSTVLPLGQAWAQLFDGASVSVSGGGSSHGRNAILTGEADIGDASSKIGSGDYDKVGCSVSESEIQAAQDGTHPWQYPECNGVTPTEWVVAWDVLTVVTHPDNDWVSGLNYSQLRAIFTTENTARYWDEVPGLDGAPHEEIQIFAPDAASGTYEFFFEEVAGSTDKSLLAEGSDRYFGSANDNEILRKISENKHSIGYFGLAYYVENEGKVQAVPIAEDGADHVEPSFETAASYPITRPLHLYTDGIPSGDTERSKALLEYLRFILSDDGQSVVPEVGYVKESDFDPDGYHAQRQALGLS